ncbi:diacylglycerol kinase family protein [Actinotalea sp.]|mgnify:CR=1 FL=1|uniref:diacylglycerol/lipid kinase family protein n=1 Tax=Actinotalea sp. TaxID=1872145 RepID=UPI002D127458|nr:diacylglycerol kinase family protein [Actinotalea sp.]HQY32806.1 diacylglycerol kinase family protein [Actinotalea sp.]HRA49712.1 diacylglycerol kinase family protein [Actinotalea sp.]
MTWGEWLSVLAVLTALVALGLALHGRSLVLALPHHGAPAHPAAAETAAGPSDRPLVAFVANPTKPGVTELRDAAVRACSARYLPEPMWLETTESDPGVGQARGAVADGARVVVAVGGDGTVRAVAEGLVGTGASMGLVPQGTGNLLARNLDLPLGDVEALLRVALTGTDRPIDVGWLTVDRVATPEADDTGAGPATAGSEHLFLVIAGLGFDAAMVADADEQLKARVGWIAYFVAGVRHLHSRRMRLDVALDDGPWQTLRLRSLLVGNCGRLPGGITLLPDAVLDDGWLDVAAIDTRGGVFGWTQLFGEVAMQRFGVRADLPNKIGTIDHARARTARVRTRDPQQVQVDGDIVGAALEVSTRVDPLALTVRVP